MKQTFTIFAVLMMALAMPKVANAYDFSAVSPSGHTIQYEIDYHHFSSTVAVVAGPSDDTTMVGDVIIPDSVQYGSQKYPVVYIKCFRARRISSLQIPNTVTHIQQDALSLCGFSTLTIPQNVMYLGGAIAMNCPNLTTVYFNAKNAKVRGNVLSYSDTNYYGRQFSWTLREIIFGDSVESIPKYICANADSLRSVIISPSVKTIGNGAFSYCDSLTSPITIGENVERIGINAFAYCKALTTINYYSKKCKSRYDSDWDGPFCGAKANQIIIGANVQELDFYMFARCTIQNNIISHAATAPLGRTSTNIGNLRLFSGQNIIVPCGFTSSYQSSATWMYNTITDDCVTILATANDTTLGYAYGTTECSPGTEITLLALPRAGSIFNGWNDGNTDNPRTIVSTDSDNEFIALFEARDTGFVHDTTIIRDTAYIDVPYAVHDTIIILDTTYIDVPFAVHDTTIVTDTVTLTEYVTVHDTTYIDVLVHDTTVVHDTNYIDVPYAVHDTTVVVDTLLVTTYIHDTGTVVIIDTLVVDNYIHDTTVFYDTLYLPVYLHDTSYVAVHDTTTLYDTLTLTEYVAVHDTLIQRDTLYLPVYLHDTAFVELHDTTILYDTLTQTEYIAVHDTMWLDVLDTLRITDTVTLDRYVYDTITEYVAVHDTTLLHDTLYFPVYLHDTAYVAVHDTTTLYDTLTVTEYVPVHDTTMQNDTLYFPVYLHDTSFIAVHDTTVVTDTVTLTEYVPMHDTTVVTDTVTLTVTEYVNIHDTTVVTDTLLVDNYIYDTVTLHDTTVVTITDTIINTVYDTVVNTLYDTIVNTLYDTIVNTLYDTVVNTIYDTIDNYIHDTTVVTLTDTVNLVQLDTLLILDTLVQTDTLTVTDTLWLPGDTVYITVYDTVYLHDTVFVGVDEVETVTAKLYQRDGQIVVEGAEGMTVTVYDVMGRRIATAGKDARVPSNRRQDACVPGAEVCIPVPATGVYLVKIGNAPAHRVVVIR